MINLFKTYWKVRKVFKFPKIRIYFGDWVTGLPMYTNGVNRIIDYFSYDVTWKDKFDTPRFEFSPMINIIFFKKLQLMIWLEEDDDYWEQLLWYLHYSGKDIVKAKNSWPWRDMEEKSTWDNKYIKKKCLNVFFVEK